MNQEKLKFTPGETIQTLDDDVTECGSYMATIHVIGEEVWLARICVYGYRQDDAEALRDRVLWALEQPTVPAQWQYYSAGVLEPGPGHVGLTGKWINLDHGGEAAVRKGMGYEVRSLYAKPPLKEV